MIGTKNFKDAAIIVWNEKADPCERINIEDADCVGLEIEYTQFGKSYVKTKNALQARNLKVGASTLENRWTINK